MKKVIILALSAFCILSVLGQTKATMDDDVINVGQNKIKKLVGFDALKNDKNTIKNADYANPKLSSEERAKDLISRMTFDEKFSMTGGFKGFYIGGVPRLGIRPAILADASQGLRLGNTHIVGKSTSFPGMLPLATTWNNEMAKKFGLTMAEECKAMAIDILLGPSMNLQRQSIGGRNYEYMGEDPLLTAQTAKAYIQGLQSLKIIPTAKHYIGNDQEFMRHVANSIIDERTLREIYLRPWEVIVKEANCMGVMAGNNVINGEPCAAPKAVLADVLRDEFGFKGLAMTDWQNSRFYPYKQDLILPSGMNLMMPDNLSFSGWVKEQIAKDSSQKAIIEKQIETMIYPTFYTLFEMGVYDHEPQDKAYLDKYPEHQQFAREVAEEAIVLLKNEDHILPIGKNKKVVLIGEPELYTGTGSGFVKGYEHITYEHGLSDYYGANFTYSKEINEELIKGADIVLFNLNKNSGEGRDIPFAGPENIISDLKHITTLHKNIIVLMNSANTMPTDWLKDVKGLVWCSYLGQERGSALANVLSGKISPSGKLAFTFEQDFNDSSDPKYNYLGDTPYWGGIGNYKKYWMGNTTDATNNFTKHIKPHQVIDVEYTEGVFIGYRWFEANDKPVVFPFGYGLSYTTFAYSDIKCKNSWTKDGTIKVSAKVSNTGSMDAKEVVQLYVSDKKSSVSRPIKELKGYQKITLKAGQTKEIFFDLDENAFNFWDDKSHKWLVEPGDFEILVGGSSQDMKLTEIVNL